MRIYKVDLIPLRLLVIYVLTGLFLSYWGPINYHDYNKVSVALYIFSFILLFAVGYIGGAIVTNRCSVNSYVGVNSNDHGKSNSIIFWVKLSIVIIFLVQLSRMFLSLADGSLNLNVLKMGEAYFLTYENYERGQGRLSLPLLIQTLTYIPYLVSLILGAFYFKQLSRIYKLMVIFIYLSVIVMETIGHGKQKQLGDIIVFLMIVYSLNNNILDPSVRKRVFMRFFLLLFMGVVSLTGVLYLRYSAISIDISNINEKTNDLMEYNVDHLIFDVFGYAVGLPISILISYVSQGYYGLSLNMMQPFEWTYFVGNSYSITLFLNKFLNIPVDFHDTYPYRTSLVTGWDDSKWSTVFAWFAGDFTYIGTLFLFSIIAFFYAKIWIESYRYKSPISIILFSMITIGLLYIPANNQLLHTPGSVFALFFFMALRFFIKSFCLIYRAPPQNPPHLGNP